MLSMFFKGYSHLIKENPYRSEEDEIKMALYNEISSVTENFKNIKSIFDYALTKKWISSHVHDFFTNRVMNQKFFLPGELTAGTAIICACMNTKLTKLSLDELFCIMSNAAGSQIKELKSEPSLALSCYEKSAAIILAQRVN